MHGTITKYSHAREHIAFDRASRRHLDENGFLHVSACHISKETVNDYYGREIPGWQDLGLEPDRIYKGYRSGPELAKAAKTFNGLPLLKEHVKDSAEHPQKELRIGNLGTDAAFNAPYLDNSLIIQDAAAIAALDPAGNARRPKRELSASYRYDPVFKPGTFNGTRYDFIMTNIRGNHVALVEEGRAGPDVVVSDEAPRPDAQTNNCREATGRPDEPQAAKGLNHATRRNTTMADNTSPLFEETVPGNGGRKNETAPQAGVSVEEREALLANEQGLADEATAIFDELPDHADRIKDLVGKLLAHYGVPGENVAKDGGPLGELFATEGNMASDASPARKQLKRRITEIMEAVRDVRPLVGEVDPVGFDSAAAIYGRALEIAGRPSTVKNTQALKELCRMACDAKPGRTSHKAVANDSTEDQDPFFSHLGRIRRA